MENEKPDYIIRRINRNSLFYNNRKQQFISLDENNQVIEVTDLGTLDSSQIICDGCNSMIDEKEIITLFSYYDGKENISRAECIKCFNKYFAKDFNITPNPLFNLCSEILKDHQARYYKKTLIDVQSANLYCLIFAKLNHKNRIQAEKMDNIVQLFTKLWSFTK